MPDQSKTSDAIKALLRYRDQVTNDPLRVAILVAHALIEELIELIIAEAVPNSECFEVPKMRFQDKLKIIRTLVPSADDKFWEFIDKLNKLRNAAAHKDYEKKRDQAFGEVAKLFRTEPPATTAEDREHLLESVTNTCAAVLLSMLDDFEHARETARQAARPTEPE